MMRQRLNPIFIILNNGTYAVEEVNESCALKRTDTPRLAVQQRSSSIADFKQTSRSVFHLQLSADCGRNTVLN